MDGERWTVPALPDRILVECCLAGDKGAWTLLLEKYERLIYGVALRQGLNETQAGDVFQNVALLLLQRLEQVRDIERLAGWLTTVTRREAWREQQHVTASRIDPTPLIEYHVNTSQSVEEIVEQWEAFEALRAAMDASDERCWHFCTAYICRCQRPVMRKSPGSWACLLAVLDRRGRAASKSCVMLPSACVALTVLTRTRHVGFGFRDAPPAPERALAALYL